MKKMRRQNMRINQKAHHIYSLKSSSGSSKSGASLNLPFALPAFRTIVFGFSDFRTLIRFKFAKSSSSFFAFGSIISIV